MYRVEDKYLLPRNDYYELQERLRTVMAPDTYAAADGQYTISSLYYDDIADTDYQDTVEGNPHRSKHRIRIYNHSLDTIKLEVKTKQYSRIAKVSDAISREELADLMEGRTIAWGAHLDDARSAFNTAILTRHLEPKVIVTYERTAYIYEPGNTRITFDTNVRASNMVERFGDGGLVYDRPEVEDYVLEVKYDQFLPDHIRQILETNTMLRETYSKYAICREVYRR